MHTARLLTVGVCAGGGYVQGDVYGSRGVGACGLGGVPLGLEVGVPTSPTQRQTPTPPCEQTDICESITLPQTSFAGGNNKTSIRI